MTAPQYLLPRILSCAVVLAAGRGFGDMLLDDMTATPSEQPTSILEVDLGDGGFVVPELALEQRMPPGHKRDGTRGDPDLVKAHDMLNAGDFRAALEFLDAATDKNPGNSPMHLARGYALANLDRPEEALAAYRKAIDIDQDSALAHAGMGRLLLHLEQRDAAEEMLRKALLIQPDLPAALEDLGRVEESNERFPEALILVERLIAAVPGDPSLLLVRARLLNRTGSPERAVHDLDRVMAAMEPSFMACAERGLSHLMLKQRKEAARDFAHALKLEPDDVSTLNNLAWLLATAPEPNMRRPDLALRLAKKACSLTDAGDFRALDSLAAAAAAKGAYRTAVKVQRRAITVAPEEAHARLQQRLDLYAAGEPLIEE